LPDQLLFLLAGAAVAAVFGYLAYRRDRRRRLLLRSWARSQGFALHEARRTGWEREYPAFPLLTRGHGRHTNLHLEGEIDGRRVRCLDYRFTTGSGRSRRTHRYGLVVMDTGAPVIPLHIRRENALDRVGEFLGGGDINFESAEFSRRFHVASADRKWAYDVIHTGMIDLLLAADVHHVAFGFAELAVYREGALTGRSCQEDLRLARRIFDLVPADVLAQLRGGSR
jgi:hypothetical protein